MYLKLPSHAHSVKTQWRKLCKKYNVDADELLKYCHGVQTIQVLRTFFPKELATTETVHEFEDVVMNDLNGVYVVPGGRELLQKLDPSTWGIVTSGTAAMASKRLNQMNLPIPRCYLTADITTKSKPDPEGYARGAELLGFKPKNCLVFEDAIAGVKAGVAAGCTVIGITSAYTREQLIEAGAAFCITDYNELEVSLENQKIVVSLKEQK
ncbi:hypothetical protein BB560_000975 [Smittium megazygosporum]|uniref:Uncharacterized protein n=1 Tax=Smittium megazygosporum TaxID=133381 RepID=A0A2T9ZIV9_9FUNG|nr:hypothetical protein BB560_000975 [Smittium megazygosporum]